MGHAEWAHDRGDSVSPGEAGCVLVLLTPDRFEKLGHTAAFAFPVVMLVIDIVLRLLIIEKKGMSHVPRALCETH